MKQLLSFLCCAGFSSSVTSPVQLYTLSSCLPGTALANPNQPLGTLALYTLHQCMPCMELVAAAVAADHDDFRDDQG